MGDEKIRLKYIFDGETRVLSVGLDVQYDRLTSQLRVQIGGIKQPTDRMIISYQDEEGDTITIRDTEDLGEAFAYHRARSLPSVKIKIDFKSDQQCLPKLPKSPHLVDRSGLEGGDSAYLDSSSEGLEKPKDKAKVKKFRWVRGNLLGTGAHGRVYMGMNEHTAELFAVKQITIAGSGESSVRRFKALEKEIRILKNLSHPNIVRYLGTEKRGRVISIFMECVPGGSITTLLGMFGSFHEKVIKAYTKQTLEGLNYLHTNGVLHRDIKGGNILVNNEGIVKLADFGCSKQMEGEEDSTKQGFLLKGTTLWMAPEVIRHSEYTMGSDVWSLGCTIIEMASGKHPWSEFKFTSDIQAMYHIGQAEGHPPITGNLSAGARDFLEKCFDPDPRRRPPCGELLKHSWITSDVQCASMPTTPRGGRVKNTDTADGISSTGLELSCRDSLSNSISGMSDRYELSLVPAAFKSPVQPLMPSLCLAGDGPPYRETDLVVESPITHFDSIGHPPLTEGIRTQRKRSVSQRALPTMIPVEVERTQSQPASHMGLCDSPLHPASLLYPDKEETKKTKAFVFGFGRGKAKQTISPVCESPVLNGGAVPLAPQAQRAGDGLETMDKPKKKVSKKSSESSNEYTPSKIAPKIAKNRNVEHLSLEIQEWQIMENSVVKAIQRGTPLIRNQ